MRNLTESREYKLGSLYLDAYLYRGKWHLIDFDDRRHFSVQKGGEILESTHSEEGEYTGFSVEDLKTI